ncbi:pyrroline-5-carboxylate reductase [Phototrophicus methaneseepsis]|uniref:Pyrroline-5-carboxylate reductase n=1 Tax=Phototrophicus methaneseepsis TaxID=2710758 RepID=A0A7S8E6W6_9CHLR|nr:pyrroline-5-carboxylate reductase [Phototrophicus methaneseepsis]QPC81475.1 pyrroline-5-carboxylate reductase [Phototrophicus methaneseepsis]
MSFEGKTIAFIGAGVMGSAIIGGLLKKKLVVPEQIIASDPNEQARQAIASQYGIQVTDDNMEAAKQAQIMVLCVKPQFMGKVLPPFYGEVAHLEMVVSIAAGVTLKTIEEGLANMNVVRAMPNTPAQIGEGISVWTCAPEVGEDQRAQAQQILEAMGQAIYVDDEKYLDMATALSGSGPAYLFLFIEAWIDAGVKMGFSRAIAEALVKQTVSGSTAYLNHTGAHPTVLRNQVTSPGGTTAAGLYELERGGLRTAVADAVWAAYKRSQELGEG